MAEFGLAAVLLLILGLGTIEIAHWMTVRQVLSLALLQAARAGTVSHGDPARIATGFEHALLPLFASGGAATQSLHAHLHAVQAATGGPPWHIAITSPRPTAYLDFDPPPDPPANGTTPGLAAHARIDNDYQALQHQRHLARGWPQGRGPQSGQTIYEANTLTLALTYPHRPLLPSTRALLRLLPGGGAYADRLRAQGYLPLSRQVSLTMQSHPALWPSLPSGKVTLTDAEAASAAPPASCPLCPDGAPAIPGGSSLGAPAGQSPTSDTTALPGSPSGDAGLAPATDTQPHPEPAPPAPVLCGIALCCAD